MSDDLDVEAASLWDGTNRQQSKLAELKLKFLDLALPEFWDKSQYLFLLMELEKELQPLADIRFGKDRIKVDAKELREGSVEVIVLLTAVGGVLHIFFKDYKDIREGVVLFVKDVKAVSSDLHKIMNRHIKGRKKNGDGSNGQKGTRHREA